MSKESRARLLSKPLKEEDIEELDEDLELILLQEGEEKELDIEYHPWEVALLLLRQYGDLRRAYVTCVHNAQLAESMGNHKEAAEQFAEAAKVRKGLRFLSAKAAENPDVLREFSHGKWKAAENLRTTIKNAREGKTKEKTHEES